jgi:hypothetical protein
MTPYRDLPLERQELPPSIDCLHAYLFVVVVVALATSIIVASWLVNAS